MNGSATIKDVTIVILLLNNW